VCVGERENGVKDGVEDEDGVKDGVAKHHHHHQQRQGIACGSFRVREVARASASLRLRAHGWQLLQSAFTHVLDNSSSLQLRSDCMIAHHPPYPSSLSLTGRIIISTTSCCGFGIMCTDAVDFPNSTHKNKILCVHGLPPPPPPPPPSQ
jgi:hypothetical protein